MSFLAWLKEEIKRTIPAVIFFLIAFHLINLTETLMLRPWGDAVFSLWTPTIAALLVGKLILIVNSLPFVDLFPARPLIYNISWKVFLYGVASYLLRSLDDFIHFYDQYRDMSLVWLGLIERWTSPVFWAVQLWLFMLFAVYVTFSEISRVLGDKQIKKMIFG